MSSITPVPLGDLAKINAGNIPGLKAQQDQTPTFWSSNPLFSFVNNVYSGFSDHRKQIGLLNPGTIENLSKEVTRDVFLTQYAFTGFKADLNKIFSNAPAFQTTHSFSIGSKVLPPYSFSGFYATDYGFFQGSVDNEFGVNGRIHYGFSKEVISKIMFQMNEGQQYCQFEQDFQGVDYSLNLKAANVDLVGEELGGVFVGSLLQAVTSKLSVGFETVYQKQPMQGADSGISYFGRYNAGKWIATATFGAQGSLDATFYRKVTDTLEAGLQTQLQVTPKPITDPLMGRMIGFETVVTGNTTIGAKYQFLSSVFRGQIDSDGKVGVFMEKRITPMAAILFSGELDHFNNTSKIGLGLSFDAPGSEQVMKSFEEAMTAPAPAQ